MPHPCMFYLGILTLNINDFKILPSYFANEELSRAITFSRILHMQFFSLWIAVIWFLKISSEVIISINSPQRLAFLSITKFHHININLMTSGVV